MKSVLEVLKWLINNLSEIAEGAIELAKKLSQLYLKGLVWLFTLAVLAPLPFFVIAVIWDIRWLIGVSGIIWAIFLVALLVFASPIGVLIETVINGVKGSGLRYVKAAGGLLLFELCFSFFGSILPISQNLSMLPLLILGAIILSLVNAWIFRKEIVGLVVGTIFIGVILSFYFPRFFSNIGEDIANLDFLLSTPKPIKVSLQEIQQRSIEFFRADGQPRFWYFVNRDGQIEVFDHSGMHPIYREKLKPISRDVVVRLEHQLLIADSLRAVLQAQEAEKRAIAERSRIEETRRKEVAPQVTKSPQQLSPASIPAKTERRLSPGMRFTFRRKSVEAVSWYGYIFTAQSIDILGSMYVQLTFSIEHTGKWGSAGTARQLLIDPDISSFVVDQNGTKYSYLSSEGFPRELPTGIPIKFTVTFRNIPPTTETLFVSLRFAPFIGNYRAGEEPDLRYTKDVVIRDLKLE